MKSHTMRVAAAVGLIAVTALPAVAQDMKAKWSDGIRLESEDGMVKLKLGGRLQSDWAILSEDDETEEAIGNQVGGHEFRRARLYFEGEIYKSVFFKAQYDFAGGEAAFKDAYVGIMGNFGKLYMGHFKEPFGLEEITSSKYITFLEQSSVTEAFAPSRNVGFMYRGAFGGEKKMERGTFSAGVFKDADGFGEARAEDEYAVTARATYLPWYQDKGRSLLHIGGAFRTAQPGGDAARFRARPENHFGDRYVDVRLADVDTDNRFGVEAALVSGPFSVQAEYMGAKMSAPGDPTFQGFYVYGSYFLTGEHRRYSNGDASFGRTKPKANFGVDGGHGAWELVARFSKLDLNDGEYQGGELQNVAVGVNWYLNPNTRFLFDWVNSDRDQIGKTNAFLARFQVDF